MKVVIAGGVAAGTKAAAKLKRECPDAQVELYTRGSHISYAGCGLPYYIGGVIENKEALIVNTPQKFMGLTGVSVHTGCEVTALDAAAKTVVAGGETVPYDKLILAVGAEPVVPPVPGTELKGVFTVRTPDDAIGMRSYIQENRCQRAVVVGGGFIGLEVAENLMKQGLSVTLMDMAPQLMPNVLDPEMADYACRQLRKDGLRVLTAAPLKAIEGALRAEAVQTGMGRLPADLVVLAVGIRPATDFLRGSGLELEKGAIVTDALHCTNLPDVYAVGDCALVHNRLTGRRQWSAMGSTANIAGRALALGLAGEEQPYPGCLGTGVVKLNDHMNAARTGLTEAQAQEAGCDVESVVCVLDDKAHYYADASSFVIKLMADRANHRLLGLQVLGSGAVDKLADGAVVAISMGAGLEDLLSMDFSYAPPFSTAIHPLAAASGILLNKITGKLNSFTPAQYAAGAAKGYQLIDAHPQPTIAGADWIDLPKTEEYAGKYDKDQKLLLVCAKGKRGYLVQNRLKALGFTNTRVLEGGLTFNVLRRDAPVGGKLPASEIKRVKGLGCLVDKRYGDVFNVRVITRNGKISTAEHRVIAEAAERFGSGEVTMTTRLTMEIQGVPFGNIDPLIAFLNENGLETGGTGSLVRPVVSCKGTTCQYGLIDTFDLSAKLHERFYRGWHSVTLPHKFKMAVGGCPNNCVKPDLNDLGIIGQRRPLFDLSSCKGCPTCQVVESCPIKIAKLADGRLSVDPEACNHCGRCQNRCPFGVTAQFETGYKVYIGGRWGKRFATGRPLDKFFTSEDEVMELVERAILLFRDEGITGERFSDTVARLGFDYVQDKLLNAKIDKTAILHKEVKGGATC